MYVSLKMLSSSLSQFLALHIVFFRVLADIFHLDAWREDPKQAIVMDLYYYTLQFARDNNFTREKTSTFFSIMKKTHEVAIGKSSQLELSTNLRPGQILKQDSRDLDRSWNRTLETWTDLETGL